MANFAFTNRVDLSFAGEEWKGAYITMRVMSWTETEKFIDARSEIVGEDPESKKKRSDHVIRTIQTQFVEGKAPSLDEKGKATMTDLKKEDIGDLPVEIVNYLLDKVSSIGVEIPKESKPSGTSSTPEQ